MSEEGKGSASMAGRMFDGKQSNQAVLPIPKEIKTAELVASSVVTGEWRQAKLWSDFHLLPELTPFSAPTEEEGSLCTALAPSLDGQLSALAIKENRALAPEEMLRSYTFTDNEIDAFQQNYFTEQAEMSADTNLTCHSIHKDTQEIMKTQKQMEVRQGAVATFLLTVNPNTSRDPSSAPPHPEQKDIMRTRT